MRPTEAGPRPFTFEGIADMMIDGMWGWEENAANTRRHFGSLWKRFADDFLKEHNLT